MKIQAKKKPTAAAKTKGRGPHIVRGDLAELAESFAETKLRADAAKADLSVAHAALTEAVAGEDFSPELKSARCISEAYGDRVRATVYASHDDIPVEALGEMQATLGKDVTSELVERQAGAVRLRGNTREMISALIQAGLDPEDYFDVAPDVLRPVKDFWARCTDLKRRLEPAVWAELDELRRSIQPEQSDGTRRYNIRLFVDKA